ncbi:MAG: hypothetical protein H0V62_09405 [Gammaproteobacteria bacterium]|nr:hypothetical protein [Gammaproteobacteria bacterium]
MKLSKIQKQRHSREGGNPVGTHATALDARLRGHDELADTVMQLGMMGEKVLQTGH